MALSGSTSTMPLMHLLQWIALERKSGSLRLEYNNRATLLYFREGRAIGCATDDPPMLLGQFLLFHGAITESVLREAMAACEETQRSLGDTLVEIGALAREDIDRLVAAKAEETILGIFDNKEDISFDFRDDITPGASVMRLELAVQELILSGAKRQDDHERIRSVFHDAQTIVAKTSKEPPSELLATWPARQIFAVIDGKKTVAQIMLHVHGTEFQVFQYLLEFLEEGLIEIKASAAVQAEVPRAAAAVAPGPPVGTHPSPGDATHEEGAGTVSAMGEEDTDVQAALSAIQRGLTQALIEGRRLLRLHQFQKALEVIEPLYRSDPGNQFLRSLVRAAEAGLVQRMSEEGLPPDKFPVLVRPPDSLAAEQLSPIEEYLVTVSDGTLDIKSLTWIAPVRGVELMTALKSLVDRGVIRLQDRQDTAR